MKNISLSLFVSVSGWLILFSPLILCAVPVDHCERKAELAVEILKSRNNGDTREANLEALKNAYDTNKQKGIAFSYAEYVDYKRMINDIFRKHEDKWTHDWTAEEVFKIEHQVCESMGF